jgi:hypothetical protein
MELRLSKTVSFLILYRLLNWLKSADKFFMATDTTLIMGPEGIIDWSNTKSKL